MASNLEYSETPNPGPSNAGPFKSRTSKISEFRGNRRNFVGKIAGVPELNVKFLELAGSLL